MSLWSHFAQAGNSLLHFFGLRSSTSQRPTSKVGDPIQGIGVVSSKAREMAKVERISDFLKAMEPVKELLNPKKLDRQCRRYFSRSYWLSANETARDTMRIVTMLARRVSIENIVKTLHVSVIRVQKWKLVYDRQGPGQGGFAGVKFELNRS